MEHTSILSVGVVYVYVCSLVRWLISSSCVACTTKVDREYAAKNASTDWAKDNDGCGTMTYDRFVDSLFELVGRL